jgi:ArsR family transcriptional regulator, virulence genes transcriptional regulator
LEHGRFDRENTLLTYKLVIANLGNHKLDNTILDMMNIQKMQVSARNASDLLKALGNEHRLMILCQLADGEKSVGELVTLIGIAQSPLSQHLARLRRDGLVDTRREAQTIFYSVASAEARQLIGLLYEMFCAQQGAAEELVDADAGTTA